METAILRRAQWGDAEAWESLYRQYSPQIRAYLWRVSDGDYALDDLCAITWERVVIGLRRYEPIRPFMAWLSVIARHVWWQERAYRQAHMTQTYYCDPVAYEDIEDTAMRRIFALELINRLPKDDQQRIIYLRAVELRDWEEIAEDTKIPLKKAQYLYRRAVQFLRREVTGILHPVHGGRAPKLSTDEQRCVASRVKRGELTQAQAAAMYGVSQAAISRYCVER